MSGTRGASEQGKDRSQELCEAWGSLAEAMAMLWELSRKMNMHQNKGTKEI